MCTATIIDINAIVDILHAENGDRAFQLWIEKGHGFIVYADVGRYFDELQKDGSLELFKQYNQVGQAKLVNNDYLSLAEEKLKSTDIKSDDPHVLALAHASGASILCTSDRNLQKDFCNVKILPRQNNKSRANYPIKGNRKRQENFLAHRHCTKI